MDGIVNRRQRDRALPSQVRSSILSRYITNEVGTVHFLEAQAKLLPFLAIFVPLLRSQPLCFKAVGCY